MRQSRTRFGVGQRAMCKGRTKTQPIELVLTRAKAHFYVRQAISVSQLCEGHGQKLIPTREVADLVVAVVALDTATKLLGVDPLHDLTENRLFGVHCGNVAPALLRKNAKRSGNR